MGPITQFDRLLEKTSKLYQTTQRYRLRDRLLNTSGYTREDGAARSVRLLRGLFPAKVDLPDTLERFEDEDDHGHGQAVQAKPGADGGGLEAGP